MRDERAGLGELELEVLKVIWRNHPCTVHEAHARLSERRDCARTTILTVMQRLHKKGFLTRRKRQGVHQYEPSEERGTVLKRLVGRFVDTVLDGSSSAFVNYLAESKGMTSTQAAELRRLLEAIEHKEG